MQKTEGKCVPSEREDFHRGVLDNLLEGCQIIGKDWRYLYINDAALSQGRASREDLLGRTMMEAYPGIEDTDMFRVLHRCMEDGAPHRMENDFRFPDGTERWFDLRFEPIPEGVFILSLDITERRRAEDEQRVTLEILQLINSAEDREDLLRSILNRLKSWSRCEAVAIRLQEGEDYPYFAASGFPEEFVRLESRLCSYDEKGELRRDASGNPVLDCMCGNILSGRFDPAKNFFTTDGSFWSNCTTDLLATTSDSDRLSRTRNRCNSSGYESVALIPLRSGKETFGLLQFNDKRKGIFTPQLIAMYRRIADHIANFLGRKQAEDRVINLNAILRGIRNVNQLITGENDKGRLIQKAVEVLVESGGYHSVVLGLTDKSGEKVLASAGAGEKIEILKKRLEQGDVPVCAREAMKCCEIVLRRGAMSACAQCMPKRWKEDQDVLAVALDHEGVLFGFMIVCLPGGSGRDAEKQELLKEVASDLSFAVHGMEIQVERDKFNADLNDTKEQLRQAQKLEAIGQLAGGVAHDFNNILSVQLGYCDLIQRGLRKEDPLSEDLTQIRICAERAAALTRQLLAFSRKQTLQPEVLDLNKLVRNLEKMLKRLIGEDVEFLLECADDLGRVKADPGQVEQVIMNIVVNARDAMPQGGKLIIETANTAFDKEYVRLHPTANAGPHVMLAISDDGCGMEKEIQDRLFEPFFTTKAKGRGTGLGLATVYGIVKQSGGNIYVYSEPGRGTTFKIYLPRVEADPVQKNGREIKTIKGNGELVLVVEDETPLRDLYARMVEKLGYRVRTAANGGEALIAVEEEGIKPHLMITDVVMPGMGGRVLANRLLRIVPNLKILFTSGYTDNAIVHHGVLDPNTPFLQKPFSIADLAAKIREIID